MEADPPPKCRGGIKCREEMEQDRAAVEAWGEAKDKAEEEWEGHSPQGRAEIVYVRNVEQQSPTLPDSPAIRLSWKMFKSSKSSCVLLLDLL